VHDGAGGGAAEFGEELGRAGDEGPGCEIGGVVVEPVFAAPDDDAAVAVEKEVSKRVA